MLVVVMLSPVCVWETTMIIVIIIVIVVIIVYNI